MRLDARLTELYSEYNRSKLQQFIKAGAVQVNGKVIKKPSYPVEEDDVVIFDEPERPDFTAERTELLNDVIYRDNNVLVINKPTGVLVHAKGGIISEYTVEDLVRELYNQDEAAAAPQNNRLGIVHRLDRATSGVIICALNNTTASKLSRQFAERKTKKTYLAVTEKTPKDLEARINLPIGRNLSRPSTFKVDAKGKTAITSYRVLKTFDDGKALVELHPHTGRTHQLRVHLNYIGCQIVGDPVYGTAKPGERLMLHAWKLEITIPGETAGQRKTFVAEPPAEFKQYLD